MGIGHEEEVSNCSFLLPRCSRFQGDCYVLWSCRCNSLSPPAQISAEGAERRGWLCLGQVGRRKLLRTISKEVAQGEWERFEGMRGVQKVGRGCEDGYFRQGAWCVPRHYGIKYSKNNC